MVAPISVENVVRFEPLSDELLAEVRSKEVKKRIARIMDLAIEEFDPTDIWQALVGTRPGSPFRHTHTVQDIPLSSYWQKDSIKLQHVKKIAGFRVRRRLPTATVGLFLARHTQLKHSEIFHQHLLSVKAAHAICRINGSLMNPSQSKAYIPASRTTGVNKKKGDGTLIAELGLETSKPSKGMVASFQKFKDEPFAPPVDRIVDLDAAKKALVEVDSYFEKLQIGQ